ncbi:MAG: hypothetical protein HY314_07895 [Acidobacteria bacterium]|nr:hypothetical protein [Acidobacteriota bacterium]
MKRTLTTITFTVVIALAGAFAFAMAQSSATQPDHLRQQEQSDQSSMPPCPMMKGMMHTMPMGNMMRHMDSMDCPMMKGHSLMAGQCMQMMLSDEDHREAMIEMFRRNPELREQLRQMLQEAEQ